MGNPLGLNGLNGLRMVHFRKITNFFQMEELYRGTGPDNVTLVGTLNELKVAADKNLMAGEMGDIYNALKTATNIVRYEANKESNKTQVNWPRGYKT